MRYTVSYDLLSAERKEYQALYDALKELGAILILDSGWAVRRTGTSAEGLRDYLWQFMNAGDRLLVTNLDGRGWAAKNMKTRITGSI